MSESLLLIVVAVLGTVVGMIMLLAVVYVCVTWKKRKVCNAHGRCWWQQQQQHTQSQDCYGFPPSHRDMVEMRCLRGCNTLVGRCCCQSIVTNNNTGVSRGLGLGGSYVNDPIPELPAPRSWTPSPPFDPKNVKIHSRCSVQNGKEDHTRNSRSYSKTLGALGTLHNTCKIHGQLTPGDKGAASYGASCNEQLSNKRLYIATAKENFKNISFDSDSICSENSSGAVDLCHVKKTARFRRRKNIPVLKPSSLRIEPCRSVTDYTENNDSKINSTKNTVLFCSDDCEKNRKAHMNDDRPAACSSYYASPQPAHHQSLPSNRPCDVFHDTSVGKGALEHTSFHHCRQSVGHEGASLRNSHIPEYSKKLSCVLPRIKEASVSPAYHSISPTRSPLISPNQQMMTSQANSQPRSVRSKSWMASNPALQPTVSREDNLISNDFADKYGFCQSCGYHPDAHRLVGGVGRITRGTQTRWSPVRSLVQLDRTQETTVDATPSLSWDHLNRAPSSAYSHTVGEAAGGVNEIDEEGERKSGECHFVDGEDRQSEREYVMHAAEDDSELGAVGGR